MICPSAKALPLLAALVLVLPLAADTKRIWVNQSDCTFQIRLHPRKDTKEAGNLWFSRKTGEIPDPKDATKKIPTWFEYGVLGEITTPDKPESEKVVTWAPGATLRVETTHRNAVFSHAFTLRNVDAKQPASTEWTLTLDQGLLSRAVKIRPLAKDTLGPKDGRGKYIYAINSPSEGCLTILAHTVEKKAAQAKPDPSGNPPPSGKRQETGGKEKASGGQGHSSNQDSTGKPSQARNASATEVPGEDWKLAGMDPAATYTEDQCKQIWRKLNREKHPDKAASLSEAQKEKANEEYLRIKLALSRIFNSLGYPSIIR